VNDYSKNSTYDVGYAKPPGHARFKKGQSGNLKGRPKGTLNLATVLQRTLREKIVITESGRTRTVTKLQAAINQLTNKAASGDLKALQLLATLERSSEERAVQAVNPTDTLDEVDERIVLGILKRMAATQNEDQENEKESDAQ
jgi:hypothetical protein